MIIVKQLDGEVKKEGNVWCNSHEGLETTWKMVSQQDTRSYSLEGVTKFIESFDPRVG